MERAESVVSGASWEALTALAAAEGSGRHRAFKRLVAGAPVLRDLADAIHLICILHGQFPGVIDLVASHSGIPADHPWVQNARAGFAFERAYLVRIAVAAGPMPSTPGQAESEATVIAQRHAVEMLGRSDRTGCALGAAAALVLDWAEIRGLLDTTADRLGLIDPPGTMLPASTATAAVVSELVTRPAIERAVLFGAQQLLLQHQGLWTLLEARAEARSRS